MMNCIEESLRNGIFMVTGFFASARVLATLSDVTLSGSNTPDALAAATRQYYGLVPNSLWPTPEQPFNWKQYYQPIPQNVISEYIPVSITLVPPDMNISPIWTIIRYPNGALHAVMRVNSTQFCDSEPGGQLKTFGAAGDVITWESSFTIDGVFFVKSAGFTPEQFAQFLPEVQAAIKANDDGAHNVILNGQIIPNV
jgi:hypothetical protein